MSFYNGKSENEKTLSQILWLCNKANLKQNFSRKIKFYYVKVIFAGEMVETEEVEENEEEQTEMKKKDDCDCDKEQKKSKEIPKNLRNSITNFRFKNFR